MEEIVMNIRIKHIVMFLMCTAIYAGTIQAAAVQKTETAQGKKPYRMTRLIERLAKQSSAFAALPDASKMSVADAFKSQWHTNRNKQKLVGEEKEKWGISHLNFLITTLLPKLIEKETQQEAPESYDILEEQVLKDLLAVPDAPSSAPASEGSLTSRVKKLLADLSTAKEIQNVQRIKELEQQAQELAKLAVKESDTDAILLLQTSDCADNTLMQEARNELAAAFKNCHSSPINNAPPASPEAIKKAALFGNREVIGRAYAKVLENKKSPQQVARANKLRCDYLVICACCGDLEQVKKLIFNYSADVNAPNGEGMYPLHGAAEQGELATVSTLLCYGADATLKAKGKTAAQYARDKGHELVAQELEKAAQKQRDDKQKALQNAKIERAEQQAQAAKQRQEKKEKGKLQAQKERERAERNKQKRREAQARKEAEDAKKQAQASAVLRQASADAKAMADRQAAQQKTDQERQQQQEKLRLAQEQQERTAALARQEQERQNKITQERKEMLAREQARREKELDEARKVQEARERMQKAQADLFAREQAERERLETLRRLEQAQRENLRQENLERERQQAFRLAEQKILALDARIRAEGQDRNHEAESATLAQRIQQESNEFALEQKQKYELAQRPADPDFSQEFQRLQKLDAAKPAQKIAQEMLFTAAHKGYASWIAPSVKAGALLEASNPADDNNTALMTAIKYCHANTVLELVQSGANPLAFNHRTHKTVMTVALDLARTVPVANWKCAQDILNTIYVQR
jgi:hypothetical protein